MNYKLFTYFLLFILLIEASVFIQSTQQKELPPQTEEGVWVKYYYNIKNQDIIVYYQGYVKAIGTSEFNLIGVCSEVTKECRKPYEEEIKQDKYIPQSQIKWHKHRLEKISWQELKKISQWKQKYLL